MQKRVVVTGLGVISCVGKDVAAFWDSMKAGKCGIEEINEFPTDDMAVKIAGKVKDFHPEDFGMDKLFTRKQDPFTVFAMAAATQAMQDCGLVSGTNIDPYRLFTYISSGVGGIETTCCEAEKLQNDSSGHWVSPNYIPSMIGNMAAGQVAIKYGAQGSCLDIVTACATSTHTIGEAFRAIQHGYADAVIAGGSEHGTIPLGLAGFANCRALSRESDPKKASLPFNANRGGFVMSDGAAILILEEYEHAVARGAKIYAEMVGYGTTCDAYHATAPRPDGTTQARCINMALEESGYAPSKDIVYVNAHGTGTHLNDVTETKAYKLAFGDEAYKIHISSTKSMHGHMFGATGAAEAIASIMALREGIVPPTINLDSPDPECDLDYTPNKAVKAPLTLAISVSFAFGGHNACISFRKV